MAEYIKRDAAIREIEQINPVDYGAMWDYEAHHWAGECLRDCKEAIDSIPTADVAPVVHGLWEKEPSSFWRWTPSGAVAVARTTYRCGLCGRGTAVKSNYCPNCGAKMDGGADHAADWR